MISKKSQISWDSSICIPKLRGPDGQAVVTFGISLDFCFGFFWFFVKWRAVLTAICDNTMLGGSAPPHASLLASPLLWYHLFWRLLGLMMWITASLALSCRPGLWQHMLVSFCSSSTLSTRVIKVGNEGTSPLNSMKHLTLDTSGSSVF